MLHTVNKSPFEKNSLDTCLRLSTAGSHILLMEDGVYAVLIGTSIETKITTAMHERKFYALDADLQARGVNQSQIINGVEIIGYDRFVELAANCDKVQSWF